MCPFAKGLLPGERNAGKKTGEAVKIFVFQRCSWQCEEIKLNPDRH